MPERFSDGRVEVFVALFQEYSSPLRLFVRHYLGPFDAADDVVQETFLQFWKKPNGYDPNRGTLKQYLFGIARKRAAQWLREEPPPAVITAEPPARETGITGDLNMILMHMEPDQRGLLWLREVEGRTYAELAEIFDVPIGTVKSRLSSARNALRRVWNR